ncbi:MAG: protein kinase [archaeon]|nr:protein kinase [archaeon]
MGNALPNTRPKAQSITPKVKSASLAGMDFTKPNVTNLSNRKGVRTKTAQLPPLELQFSKIASKITEKNEINFLNAVFKTHPLFSLSEADFHKNSKLRNFQKIKISKGSNIYNIEEAPEYMYIIYKGNVILESTPGLGFVGRIGGPSDQNIKLKEKDSFGEHEIYNSLPRLYTAKCGDKEDCILFILNKVFLQEIININRKAFRTQNNDFLMKNLSVLNNYESIRKSIVLDGITMLKFHKDTQLFPYGCIYVVVNGELISGYKNEKIKTLRQGDFIGHKEIIIENSNGVADLIACPGCELFSIPISSLINILGKECLKTSIILFVIGTAFKRCEVLESVEIGTINKIYQLFEAKQFNPNEIVYKKGELLKEKIIIAAEGNLFIKSKDSYEALRGELLYPKEIIGNAGNVLVLEDILSLPFSLVLECDNEKIKKALNGQTITDIIISNDKAKKVQGVLTELLKHCRLTNVTKQKLRELEKNVIIEKYASNTKIIEEGSKDIECFYFIHYGAVNFYKDSKYIRTLKTNSFFGLKATLINSPIRTATAIAATSLEVFKIKAKAFINLFMNDNAQLAQYFKSRLFQRDETVQLSDLEHIKLLGKGGFGFVNLVRSKKNKCLYAIKAIPVKKVIQYDMYELISNERNLLRRLDYELVMKSVKSFKNDEFAFILNEYIKGKTLGKLLKETGSLNKQSTLFYSACLVLVIEYLHYNCIIHRDIKPENIMINESGYIKLIDFGIAKEMSSPDSCTNTIIGTPYYMSPEMIKGESYSNKVDYWALGVLIYELFTGKVPFGAECKDPTDIYNAVLNSQLNFTQQSSQEKEFVSLINGLLNKDKNKRICGKEVMKCNWFNSIDWDALEQMNVAAPLKCGFGDYDSASKGGNYMVALKQQVANMKDSNDKKDKVITDFDIQKAKKWLEDF